MQTTDDSARPVIALLGHPVLRLQARAVDNILGDDCQALIQEMMETVEQAGGVGIAAPQIYQSLRVFIICSKPNERYPDAPLMPPTAMINPEIIEASAEVVKDWEGCLSVPGLRGLVPRHQEISVRYTDQQGQLQQCLLTGFVARIFQRAAIAGPAPRAVGRRTVHAGACVHTCRIPVSLRCRYSPERVVASPTRLSSPGHPCFIELS